jgi:purine nucleosidase
MSSWNQMVTPPRFRVISDNDYAGDPDGLVQLAHHLLSPSVEIRAIISSHLRLGDGWDLTGDSVAEGKRLVQEMANVLQITDLPELLSGSSGPLLNSENSPITPAAKFIIDEANRTDVESPLFVVCGGSLTSIATAWLADPTISSKLIVIWIGGPEYPGHRDPPPNAMPIEYNLLEDLIAGQIVFNQSDLKLWQIPRNIYRDCNVSTAELIVRMRDKSSIGAYLFEKISQVARSLIESSGSFSEVYSLGDSPLVLLTALQTGFEPSPASSQWVDIDRPEIDDNGQYRFTDSGKKVRVFTYLDVRMMFEDMYAKFELTSNQRGD